MQEAEYKRDFDVMSNQITAARQVFYTYIEINKFGDEGKESYNKLNRDGHFWSVQLYALQTTCFIILGRIFDRTKGAYSIHDFLASTVTYPDFFSKRALAERKRTAARQAEPEWLGDYLKSAWEPGKADLAKLRSIIATSVKKWDKIYKPIRDKIFAHNHTKGSVDALLQGALIGDIVEILHDLNKILIHIFQMLENGREYWISNDDRSYADPFIGDARKFLSHL